MTGKEKITQSVVKLLHVVFITSSTQAAQVNQSQLLWCPPSISAAPYV